MTFPSWRPTVARPHSWHGTHHQARHRSDERIVGELFSSDFTLIGATLAGLALTSLGILHDLGPFRLEPTPVEVPVEGTDSLPQPG